MLAGDLTPELVASLHEQGVAVFGRVTDSPADWGVIREAGADGLLTDDLVGYSRWAASVAP